MARLSDADILERIRGQDSVCRACAEGYGAVWPDGHEATHFYGECGFCQQTKAVCCTSDWNWPHLNKKDQKNIKAKREF